MKVLTPGLKTALALFCFFLLMPQRGNAIPAFARKYGVKCYTCHTIPPALNKNGYMFKRLGYRMPPDEMDGTKAAPKVSELDKDIAETGATPPTATSTTSSFNLDEAAFFVAGA